MKLTILLLIFFSTIAAGCSHPSSTSTGTSTTPPPATPKGWTDSLSLGPNAIVADFATIGTNVFIMTENGIFYSENEGLTAVHRDSTILFNGETGSLFLNGTVLFANVPGAELMRSTDLGITWKQVGATIMANSPFVYNSAIYTSSPTNTPAYRSTDNGSTWTSISSDLPSQRGSQMIELNDRFYIGAGAPLPIWFSSTDQGGNWNVYGGSAYTAFSNDSTGYGGYYACKVVTEDG